MPLVPPALQLLRALRFAWYQYVRRTESEEFLTQKVFAIHSRSDLYSSEWRWETQLHDKVYCVGSSKVNSVFLACGLCTRCNWNRNNFTRCNCSHSGVVLVVQNKTLLEPFVWRNPKLHANVRQAVGQELHQTDQFASRVAASRFIAALTYLGNIPISLHLQGVEAERCLPPRQKRRPKTFCAKMSPCHPEK